MQSLQASLQNCNCLIDRREHVYRQNTATREDFKAYYALRYRVLREPWGYPKGTEKDDYEPISEHFMAVNEKGEVAGVVKLYEKVRRWVTSPTWQ